MKVEAEMRNRSTLVGQMRTDGASVAGRPSTITFKLLYLGKLLKLSNKGLYRKT